MITSLFKKLVKFSYYFILVLIILHVLIPILALTCPHLLSHLIFQDRVNLPFRNLSNPTLYGLEQTFHFKLQHDDVSLGVWHTLPKNYQLKATNNVNEHFRTHFDLKKEKEIVVLYLHGNTQDRAAGHRVQLYKILQSLGYHVISMDYRAYGDSTGTPTEDDVVKDALFIFDFIREKCNNATIYVWGHSLGTGIGTKLNYLLSKRDIHAEGVILEAPFFNILEEIEFHPIGRLFSYNPWLVLTLKDALNSINLSFRSDIYIQQIKSKILILHAEDDFIIPIHQGEKLYELAKKYGASKSIDFIKFDYNQGLGHREIWSSPKIVEIIKKFII